MWIVFLMYAAAIVGIFGLTDLTGRVWPDGY